MKVIQVYDKLDRHGGAQSVIMILDKHFLSQDIDIFLSGIMDYKDIFFKKNISKDRYISFSLSNIFSFSNSIVISHSRKMTTVLVIANTLLNLKCEIVHVSHAIFLSKKMLTLYPKNIIAVSHAVKKNLIDYFDVKKTHIDVIYNGLPDSIEHMATPVYEQGAEVKILFIGRIENLKQQISVVNNLSGKLNKNIQIHFVGNGSKVKDLIQVIDKKGFDNFKYIGFSDDIPSLISKYNYVMLFSQQEGLGLSLVEGCMMGRPLITRGIDGCEACAEVCLDRYNGFIINTFDNLIIFLNKLDQISHKEYQQLCIHARKTYKDKFQLDIMLSRYTSYINNLISNY